MQLVTAQLWALLLSASRCWIWLRPNWGWTASSARQGASDSPKSHSCPRVNLQTELMLRFMSILTTSIPKKDVGVTPSGQAGCCGGFAVFQGQKWSAAASERHPVAKLVALMGVEKNILINTWFPLCSYDYTAGRALIMDGFYFSLAGTRCGGSTAVLSHLSTDPSSPHPWPRPQPPAHYVAATLTSSALPPACNTPTFLITHFEHRQIAPPVPSMSAVFLQSVSSHMTSSFLWLRPPEIKMPPTHPPPTSPYPLHNYRQLCQIIKARKWAKTADLTVILPFPLHYNVWKLHKCGRLAPKKNPER